MTFSSAQHGELDRAVHHELTAFGYDRKTEASLLTRAADLDPRSRRALPRWVRAQLVHSPPGPGTGLI